MFKLFRAGECRRTDKSLMSQRQRTSLSVKRLGYTEVDYFYGRAGALRRPFAARPAVAPYHFGFVRLDEHQVCRL